MADDIAALIANSGKADPKTFDFSSILDSYRKGQDWAYQQKLRNLYSDENGGLPRNPKTGQVDWGQAFERLVQAGGAGGIDQAAKLAETGMMQDRYNNAPTVQAALDGRVPPSPTQEGPPATSFPPSTSRNAPAVVAPPLNRGGIVRQPDSNGLSTAVAPATSAGWQGGDAKNSLIGFLSANGVPEQDQGSVANILGGQLAQVTGRRVDPNAPLDLNNMQVRQVLTNFLRGNRRPGVGGSQPSAAPVVPAMPATPQVNAAPQQSQMPSTVPAAAADATLGGLIPPGYQPGPYLQRLQAIAASGRVLPDQLKVLEQKITAIQSALQPTTEQKNAAAAGMPMREYIDRNDAQQTERAILTGSILPKLDKSQEQAIAARDEVMAINRAREQIDAPGGIFSGTAADTRLKLAKVAEFMGIPNADRIANTESFGSAIGQRTLSLVKGLGAGAGISNADRDFAAAMAGGNIRLDEKSIRRILDIGERAARARIELHNGLTDRTLKSSDALKDYGGVYRVDQPEQYQRAEAPPKVGSVFGGFKYLGGNPNDQRSWGKI